MNGLPPDIRDRLVQLFAVHPEVERVILYGSRAKGTHRNGSDIDLVMEGRELTRDVLLSIEREIEDLLLPYRIDLSILQMIGNRELLEHIDRVGRTWYEKRG